MKDKSKETLGTTTPSEGERVISRNILIASEPNLDIYLKRLYSDPTALSSEAILMTLVTHGG